MFEPGGAPPEARLNGLAWAIDHGAMDHTIRLGPVIPIEGYKKHYHELFEMMADILGPRLKRMTIDILRFSPQMPGILRASFPEEIVSSLLTEMEPAVKAHTFMFLRAGDIASMPCACHISYQDRQRIQRKELPMLTIQK